VDAALDVFLFLFFLVVDLDLADAAADVAFLFLVPPAVDEVDAALRDFPFPVASLFESSPFLLDKRNPFTPAPEPPMISLRPFIHEKESDALSFSSF
jgi:hypothetical protein